MRVAMGCMSVHVIRAIGCLLHIRCCLVARRRPHVIAVEAIKVSGGKRLDHQRSDSGDHRAKPGEGEVLPRARCKTG
ncbi:hypothetical protein MUK42_30086 [Musa troglodytarum]|uniref:Secreted protein n=1 Tax=Musa troglodytarum TaxID=320322 RepID=A0A9E7FJI3_9LILI|nr:hypothetical protein MUK42_30086 [Musa troglodytarum]